MDGPRLATMSDVSYNKREATFAGNSERNNMEALEPGPAWFDRMESFQTMMIKSAVLIWSQGSLRSCSITIEKTNGNETLGTGKGQI